MRKYIIIFFLFFSFYQSYSDNTYRYAYSKKELYTGGKMIVNQNKDGSLFSWFIKPFFTDDNEVIYTMRGFDNSIMNGSSLGGMNVISAVNVNSNLLSTWKDANRVFISYLDTNINPIGINEIFGQWNFFHQFDAKWIKSSTNEKLLLLINNSLYKVSIANNKLSNYFIYGNVTDATYQNITDTSRYCFLVNKDGNGILYFINNDYAEKIISRVSVSDDNYIYYIDDYAVVISSNKSYNTSLIQIINRLTGNITDYRIETSGKRIKIIKYGDTYKIFYIKSISNGYTLEIADINDFQKIENRIITDIPFGLIEPQGLWFEGDNIYALFRNGLVSLDLKGNIESSDFYQFGEYFNENPEFKIIDKNLIFSTKNASIRLERIDNYFWLFNRFIRNFGKTLVPLILFIAFVVTFRYYTKQKRYFNSLMNLPSSGIVFILDHYGKLIKINDSARSLLGITEKVPLKKHYQYYFVLDYTKSLLELLEKSYFSKEGITQRVNIRKDEVDKEFYFYINPLIGIIGNFRGWVVTGIDITEELERKRLSNWAQLAHDMQTNLSTIKLNADLIEVDNNGNNFERKKRIIFQANVLIQRVRDIVTVGRNDSLARQVYDAFDICHEVRAEFDDTVFPHVSFIINAEHENVLCDNRKIVRALRNAVENGIKSLKGSPGTIKISNSVAGGIVFFKVKDTGPGMDEDTKAKILIPYFTTAAKHGGSGIGTMIMQHVMELHNGNITINSEVGKGTEVVFSFPNELVTKGKGRRN
jgi:two-component system phosphate regulon sensor histidine kinase PhoR